MSYGEYISLAKQMAPAHIHVKNKNEGELLRKLMSQTGLSEWELRENKKYRIELSQAQKAKGEKNQMQRYARKLLKSVTKELKLAKEHPLVLEKLRNDMILPPRHYYMTTSAYQIAIEMCIIGARNK